MQQIYVLYSYFPNYLAFFFRKVLHSVAKGRSYDQNSKTSD